MKFTIMKTNKHIALVVFDWQPDDVLLCADGHR
jgi:hypothetical protein